MVIGFAIWSIVSVIFMLLGVSARKSKKEVGFFTIAEPPKMKDVVKYNHAVGKLWFSFAVILEIMGIPFLFAEQNSPIFIFIIFGTMMLVIAIIVIYMGIERKYRRE